MIVSLNPEIPFPFATKNQVDWSAGLTQTAGCVRTSPPCGTETSLKLAAHVGDPALPAQVREVQQAKLRVLPALDREHSARVRRRENRRGGAAEVEVLVVELLEIRRRVAVERIARRARPVRPNREHRVSPVVVRRRDARGVEVAVSRREEKPVQRRLVDDARPRPDRRLHRGAIGRPRSRDEVHGLIAAVRVEDVLRPAREIDRGHVPLVVAPVAGIAAVRDVETGMPVLRDGDREGRRSLLVEPFERRDLRPPSGRRLDSVPDAILMDLPVETVAVDERAGRVHRRGRRRVTGVGAVVDLAASRGVLVRPDDRSGRRVDGEQVTRLRRQKQKVERSLGGRDAGQVSWRAVRNARKRDLILLREIGDARAVDHRLLCVVSAVLGVEIELRPRRRARGARRRQGE